MRARSNSMPTTGPAQKVVEIAKVEATVEPPKEAAIKPVVRPKARDHRQTRHTQPKSAKVSLATRHTRAKSANVSVAYQRRQRPRPITASSNSTNSPKTSVFDRLVGFLGLSPDPSLSN